MLFQTELLAIPFCLSIPISNKLVSFNSFLITQLRHHHLVRGLFSIVPVYLRKAGKEHRQKRTPSQSDKSGNTIRMRDIIKQAERTMVAMAPGMKNKLRQSKQQTKSGTSRQY